MVRLLREKNWKGLQVSENIREGRSHSCPPDFRDALLPAKYFHMFAPPGAFRGLLLYHLLEILKRRVGHVMRVYQNGSVHFGD